jgi:hypothetical protein
MGKLRWCACGRHAVWWRDAYRGELSVHDQWRGLDDEKGRPAAFVLGLHNGWLQHPLPTLCKEDYDQVLEETPDTYLFKKLNSVAIRIRPGHSSDTKYDELPEPYRALTRPPGVGG